MIYRELTNLYISYFDLLTEALYQCWINSYCEETDQLNKETLRAQIKSHGLYDHKHAIKKERPINFIDKVEFKSLIWVNKFVLGDEVGWGGYIELYKQVINEVENNLFALKEKSAQLAYAKILLRNLDKSHIHKRKLKKSDRDLKYKETFEIVLDREFMASEIIESQNSSYIKYIPNYDLSARLLNHLDFIDKLIELFNCFDIDLIELAGRNNHNLYLFIPFIDKLPEVDGLGDFSTGSMSFRGDELIYPQLNVTPKFNSDLSDECLVKVMHYLLRKKKLESGNIDVWLYWFNRKYIKIPEPLKWKGSNTLLSNLIQHLCGESNSLAIRTAFGVQSYVKPTRKTYASGVMYKEIEQIIIISKRKNV